MKRMLYILACLLMALVLPAIGESLKKVDTEYKSGDYTYTLDSSNGAVVTKYGGSDSKLKVPSLLDGHPVKAIGDFAFSRCENLTSVTLPEGLESIGDSAFFLCENLTSITLPDGLKFIRSYAFKACKNLTTVTLSESIEAMGYNPFSYCDRLSEIRIEPDHPLFTVIDGVLFNKVEKELVYYPINKNSKSYNVPDGVKSIGGSAFIDCEKLSSITLPEGLESISPDAFYSCGNLTSITLPEGLKSIGMDAFFACKNLTSITLPEGLEYIGASAFCSCRNLDTVTLPDSIKRMDSNPFVDCGRLARILVEPDHPVFALIDGVLFNKVDKKLIFYPIGRNGESYSVPAGVKFIDSNAFFNCKNLTSITLQEGLESIGLMAFEGCKNLTSITLPASLSSIGINAINKGAVLTVSRDSFAEKWAKENGFVYQYLDSAD